MRTLWLLAVIGLAGCTTPNERRMAQLDRMHEAGQIPTKDWIAQKNQLAAEDRAYSERRALQFQSMSWGGGGGGYAPYRPYGTTYPGYYGATSWAPPGTYFNPIAVKVER